MEEEQKRLYDNLVRQRKGVKKFFHLEIFLIKRELKGQENLGFLVLDILKMGHILKRIVNMF